MSRLISRRTFLGSLVAAGATSGYARLIEPQWLDITTRRIPIGRTAGPPLRVLHLSDLHASDVVPLPQIAHAISLGLQQKPDVVFLTGDFVTRRRADLAQYSAVLRPLAAAAPTFACAGNHDGGSWAHRFGGYPDLDAISRLCADSGIDLLQNTHRQVTIAGRPWQFVGLGDIWADDGRASEAFAGLARVPGVSRLVLSHNPDSKEMLEPYEWDAAFFGHTHGGQFYLPLVGAPFAPVVDKRFIAGLYRWSDRWLHISRGVGNLHGVRFNCRPEITLVEVS
ncbi:MAG TPA: phosphodiesterase YaeI [Candidatus Didemnitutus sp.]|nr:phosphodiesterase YaeI [Candidatus Didemnitutus sp.]